RQFESEKRPPLPGPMSSQLPRYGFPKEETARGTWSSKGREGEAKSKMGTLWKASLPRRKDEYGDAVESVPTGSLAHCGFTLIELLVVIAIMALLAAMIIPIRSAISRAEKRDRV